MSVLFQPIFEKVHNKIAQFMALTLACNKKYKTNTLAKANLEMLSENSDLSK